MIEIRDLDFSFKDKVIFDSISFSLNEGETVGVIGKNAVGKTTLINILTGLYSYQNGNIKINGVSIDEGVPNSVKKQIGVMRQIDGLFRKMTCLQYLEFVAALYEIKSTSIIFEYANKLDFIKEINTQIKKCSLGTIKKVEFVASIIHNPQILILDEPFESVDPLVINELKKFIKLYSSNERIVIITSHILDILQNVCNRYIFLDNKKVIYNEKIDLSQSKSQELERIFVEKIRDNE